MKGLNQTAAVVECILFLENRTLTVSEISRLSHINEERVENALKEIRDAFDDASHGIMLEKTEEGYQFVPRTTLYERLKKTYGKKVDTRLSRAAVETLTIIAYNQPVKRREIDNIRGSNSEDIVKRLRELDYIKIIDKTDEPGHPCRYGTTRKFLYDFNLPSIAALPRLDREDSERFEETDENGNPLSGTEIKKRLYKTEDEQKIEAVEESQSENSGTSDFSEIEVIDETQKREGSAQSSILVKHQKNYSENASDEENNENLDEDSSNDANTDDVNPNDVNPNDDEQNDEGRELVEEEETSLEIDSSSDEDSDE